MSGFGVCRDVFDGDRKSGNRVLTPRLQIRAARREQDLALQNEAVPDDLNPWPVGQHVTQLAEEVAAITLQFLHLGGQRHVQF